jgi:hypothetical protein
VHDLAAHMAALKPFVSLTRFGEGIGSHDFGMDLALIDEPTDLGELSGVGAMSSERSARACSSPLAGHVSSELGEHREPRSGS